MNKWLSIIFGLIFSHFALAYEIDESCKKLFEKAKLKSGPDCLSSCASVASDAPAFSPESLECADQCLDFCQSDNKASAIFQMSDLYPNLTKTEKALAASHPVDTLKAYKLSWKAEEICKKVYLKSLKNDESDACRHFAWAILIAKELGPGFAAKILNAHEDQPDQPEKEREMDIANNKLGLRAAERMLKEKTFSDEKMLKMFNEDLQKGRLIVIEPGAKRK